MNRPPLHFTLIVLTLALSIALLPGCARKPMVAISTDSAPFFSDDLDVVSLQSAVHENLAYLRKQPSGKTIVVSDQVFPVQRLILSLEYFLSILASNPSAEELDRLVRQHFDIYQATGINGFNPGRKMLVTGYFQPEFQGSLTRKAPFFYPLYSVPDDLIRTENKNGGGQGFGRLKNGKTVPYWTRKEIERDNRATGFEMVWLKDPFDAFVLHVQGSGLIRLQDGTLRAVHYAAKNGQPYRSIGKYLVETGKISLEEASLQTIREYVAGHPEEQDEIFYQNPSFIFFQWTKSHGAIGNLGRELTAGRSIAVDQSCFPAGSLGFLQTRRPSKIVNNRVAWTPVRRFVLVQDTGSAIRGSGRVDLFWGTGAQAGLEAGQMKEKGTLYFLLLKDQTRPLTARH